MFKFTSLVSAAICTTVSLFMMSQSFAEDENYLIIACDDCTQVAMKKAAENSDARNGQVMHVYDDTNGILKAYLVQKDDESGMSFSTETDPHPCAANLAADVFKINPVPQPTVPESIASSAWDYANFPAIQNQTRNWLSANSDWQVQAMARVQALTKLYNGAFQPERFYVHLESGGKVAYLTNSFAIDGNGMTLHLVFDYAEDKDGNAIAHTRSDFNKSFTLSGGADGTAVALTQAATTVFGIDNVAFNIPMTPDIQSTFTCSAGVDDNELRCIEVK